MFDRNTAIQVENVSKIYRIGTKDDMQENFAQTVFQFVKNPVRNYRKYRSLYEFDDVDLQSDDGSEDHPASVLWAVKDVSFDLKKGEVLGIIGRNGAGKSTLLKILCRITDPTTGRVQIRGRISSLLEVGTGFHPELTGRENVFLNGTILGMTKTEIKQKFDEIVHFSGVEKFIETPVKRYSSGMKVRLAFSVAAHLDPEILIVDEVLAVGDAEFQKKCLNKMEDVGQRGRTVIFVSHNLPAVCRLCHRVILLEQGRIVEDGSPARVVSGYLNSDLGTSASRKWTDPQEAPGGEFTRLRAVCIKDEEDRVSNTIDIRRPFKVEMVYQVIKGGSVLLPIFAFENEEGLRVFTTVDLDSAWRKHPRPEGRFVSTVHVPGNLLAEGMFFVNCTLLTLSPESVEFQERSALAFQVIDNLDGESARGDYAKTFPGIVRPMLEWTTEFNPALGDFGTT